MKTKNWKMRSGISASRSGMSLTAQYARTALQDPVLKEMYTQRAKTGFSPLRMAANDFLQRPFIRDLDVTGYHGNQGDKIRASAGDKVGLTEVRATLLAADGTLVESGACVLDLPTGKYMYAATCQMADTSGMSLVIAVRDIPGNVVEKPFTL